MKNLYPFFFVLLALLFGFQKSIKSLEFHKLTKNAYVYTTYKNVNNLPYPSNSMYLVTDSGVVLFDTPWDTTQFQPLLYRIEARHHKKVVLCISTHYHDDRTAGLEFFRVKGIKTYTSFQTYQLCELKHEKQAEFYFLNDTTFIVGQYKIQTFYPGAGHSKDNIVLWVENEKIMYAACFVKSTESHGLGNLADADLMHWQTSLESLKKKFPNPKFIIPGHQSWKSNKSIDYTIKLLEEHR